MEIKRVAIYARVSSKGQEDNTSLADQLKKCEEYAKIREWKVVSCYRDISSGGNMKREGYQSMMANTDKFDAVLVLKLDRIHRNQLNLLEMVTSLQENGKSFVSIQESFDTSTPAGRAMLGFFSTIAQLERETIKERITAGKKAKARTLKAREHVHGAIPTGYKKDWSVDPDIPVHQIFLEFSRGKKLASISRKYGIAYTTVRRMLTNRAYLGELKLYGEIHKDHHKQLVSPVLFGKVQKKMKR